MGDRIAVLLPCYNEAIAIGTVVRGFRAALPGAAIYVYDNNSTDDTAQVAKAAGAIVRHEPVQGKGNVVRRMFADIDADIYVLANGDGTYDPADAPALVERLVVDRLDMVVGARQAEAGKAYRAGHAAGNRLFSALVTWLFQRRFSDMLSGYRAMSRRFVKSFPALATGFETETELTVHVLELRMPVVEVPVSYAPRQRGSHSKLSPWGDGVRILAAVIFLFKETRPFKFFGGIAVLLAAFAVWLGVPLLDTYLRTGLVPRFPTAILASAIMVIAAISFLCGIILDTVSRGRREAKRMHYLSLPALDRARDGPP